MFPKFEQEEENDNCKVKICSKREKRVPLFITDFSHGQVKINIRSELRFQCFKKNNCENRAENEITRNLVATNGRLNYIGNSNVSSLRYFVGVRDKTSGKMKLYDCVIFRMKPNLVMVSNQFQSTSKSYTEARNMLTENFGSKAKKRALSLQQKYTIDPALVKEITVNTSVLQSSPNKLASADIPNSIDYLPPLNRIASSVNDVFNIRHIISLEEDTSLNIEAQELLTAPLDEFTKKRFSFCKYVSMRLENVSAERAKYLLYFNYLIIFQRLKYDDIRKINPTTNIPDPYKKNILERFTVVSRTNGGRTVRSCSNLLKDKLVSYIFVLGLFIDDFNVNLDEIAEDINNVKVPKLKTIAEALGCYISRKKSGEQHITCAELKIPLYVPIPKFVRRKK